MPGLYSNFAKVIALIPALNEMQRLYFTLLQILQETVCQEGASQPSTYTLNHLRILLKNSDLVGFGGWTEILYLYQGPKELMLLVPRPYRQQQGSRTVTLKMC